MLNNSEYDGETIQGYDGNNCEDKLAVLCILSHGTEGAIYGSDGNLVQMSDIMDCLHDRNCPQMSGKPKIIIF